MQKTIMWSLFLRTVYNLDKTFNRFPVYRAEINWLSHNSSFLFTKSVQMNMLHVRRICTSCLTGWQVYVKTLRFQCPSADYSLCSAFLIILITFRDDYHSHRPLPYSMHVCICRNKRTLSFYNKNTQYSHNCFAW